MSTDGGDQTEPIHVHTDGASRGNPGPASCAYVLSTPDGSVLDTGGDYLGRATNNEAEYRAVILALERVVDHGGAVAVHSDSQLLVNQVNGDWRVSADNLRPLHRSVSELAERIGEVTFEERRRGDATIQVADALCNDILDEHLG